MRILAFDPGNTTGIAYIEWDGTTTKPDLIDFAEVDADDMPCWVYGCLKDNEVDLIVVERFTISMETIRKSRQPAALDNIGGIKWLAKLFKIPVRLQGRSDAKTAYTDKRIAEYGIKSRHARDALRHALLATHSREVYSMCTDTDKTTGATDGESRLAEAEEPTGG